MDKKKKLDVDKRIKPVDSQEEEAKNKNPGHWSDKVTLASVSSTLAGTSALHLGEGTHQK